MARKKKSNQKSKDAFPDNLSNEPDRIISPPPKSSLPTWLRITFWSSGLAILLAVLLLLIFRLPPEEKKEPIVVEEDEIEETLLLIQTDLYDIKAQQSSLESKMNSLSSKISRGRKKPISGYPIKGHVLGADISHWQGDIVKDLESKPEIGFVICKATDGLTNTDPRFRRNWTALGRKKGMVRGAYHFFEARDQGSEQANFYYRTVQLRGNLDLPPIVDFEPAGIKGFSRNRILSRFDAFLKEAEKLFGQTPIIYVDRSLANEYLTDPKYARYPLWLAEWGVRTPHIPGAWRSADKYFTFWQKTNRYSVNTEDVDFDYFPYPHDRLLEWCRSNVLIP